MEETKKQYDNNNKGALWISDLEKTRENPNFPKLKGSLQIKDIKYEVLVFKNNFKEKSTHPDYKIVIKEFQLNQGLIQELVEEATQEPMQEPMQEPKQEVDLSTIPF